MKSFFPLSILVTIIWISSAYSQSDPAEYPEFQKLVPNVKQTQPVGKPKTFVGKDLFEYINGGAEPYHDYDFVKVIAQKYTWQGVKDEFSVDIYDMGNTANAFGMVSVFRLEDGEALSIGAECQFTGSALDFFHGQYYVQVGGPPSAADIKKKLITLGKAVSALIKVPAKKPAELDLLLKEGRIPRTEKYVKNNLLGYGFLKEAWCAEYKVGQMEKAVLHVLLYANQQEAKTAYEEYLAKNKAAKEKNIPKARECFFNKDKYAGHVGACVKGDKVIIVTDAPDDKETKSLLIKQLDQIPDTF